MWDALDVGRWSRELLEAGLAAIPHSGDATGAFRNRKELQHDQVALFLFGYHDGVQGAIAMLAGVARANAFVARMKGDDKLIATHIAERPRPYPHFTYLLSGHRAFCPFLPLPLPGRADPVDDRLARHAADQPAPWRTEAADTVPLGTLRAGRLPSCPRAEVVLRLVNRVGERPVSTGCSDNQRADAPRSPILSQPLSTVTGQVCSQRKAHRSAPGIGHSGHRPRRIPGEVHDDVAHVFEPQ